MAKTTTKPRDKSLSASSEIQKDLEMKNVDANLHQLFISAIKEIYWCENHLVGALPKMISAAKSKELQQAIAEHLEKTRAHAKNLEHILDVLKEDVVAKKCDACEGLVLSGEHTIDQTPDASDVRDIGIIMSSLKVENFEITTYNGIIQLANKLGYREVGKMIERNLEDELDAEQKLTALSETL